MCTYLAKRGATYYFRRLVPDELRPALGGRREWMLSLRTKDREAAKRAVPAHTVATDRQIDAARAALAVGAPEKPASAQSERAGSGGRHAPGEP